jgi:hypothetical protein
MSIDGKYGIIIESRGARQKATLELSAKGASLSGTITGAMGKIDFEGGSVDGANLAWTMFGSEAVIMNNPSTWTCTARIDGDKIDGLFKLASGDTPFAGSRVRADGVSDAHSAPAIPWVDKGLPRYEACSVEWVRALDEYIIKKTKGKAGDIPAAWSTEYTDPPAHLLRNDGRKTIGFTMKVQDGTLRCFDGPDPEAGMQSKLPYDPMALTMRFNSDQLVEWMAKHGASIKREMKFDEVQGKIINRLVAGGTGNEIREEFYSQQTK